MGIPILVKIEMWNIFRLLKPQHHPSREMKMSRLLVLDVLLINSRFWCLTGDVLFQIKQKAQLDSSHFDTLFTRITITES